MRFHILGIPHTQTRKEQATCAYTQKIYKLCKILYDQGHTVYHYGTEGSNPSCTEQINTISEEEHNAKFGDQWKTSHSFDITDEHHQKWYNECAKQIRSRLERKDFVLCMWGLGVKKVLELIPELYEKAIVVEPGIGYHLESGLGPEVHKVYESYNWMAYNYGRLCHPPEGANEGYVPRNYDCVIPNYWDPEDFIFSKEKDDYFLFFGRVIERKGTYVAMEACEAANVKLIVAGQGNEEHHNLQDNQNIEYIGFVDNQKRAELMSRAKAVFVPTQYFEPFGGVAVEAQMCGTPVICSDFGVFNETVLHGITGYRCRTLDQYVWAINNVHKLDPYVISNWAINNFSLTKVGEMYEEYFSMLYQMWNEGWYARRKEINGEWLKKIYPETVQPRFISIEEMAKMGHNL